MSPHNCTGERLTRNVKAATRDLRGSRDWELAGFVCAAHDGEDGRPAAEFAVLHVLGGKSFEFVLSSWSSSGVVEFAQQALGTRDLLVRRRVAHALDRGDLVVAVAKRQAQQEPAWPLR